VPDEQSNLNSPAPARRSAGRRRGRRGGRGRARVPRPPVEKQQPTAEDLPPAPEPAEEAVVHDAIAEPEADAGGFREPHPVEPSDLAPSDENSDDPAEPVAEAPAAPAAEIPPAPQPEREPQRLDPPPVSESRYQEPQRPKPWTKPADFRPAETSAVSQAVAHATEIAESLRHLLDQLDEILELVEVAERQKLADEREIEELRRALRRIQPQRHQPQQSQRGPRQDEPQRGYRDHGQRRDEPRRDEPRREDARREESRPPRAEPQQAPPPQEEAPPSPPESDEPPF